MWSRVIAIDFDGTLTVHKYPRIGREIPGAVRVCRRLQEEGHLLILLSMRFGKTLREAQEWCSSRHLTFWATNENPEQRHWTDSPKVYADVYIDDTALGCPLCPGLDGERPYVDWDAVEGLLEKMKILVPKCS
jgi:hypothetical protein